MRKQNMNAYCSSVLYLCCLQLDPSRTSLCRLSSTSGKGNSRTFVSFERFPYLYFLRKETTTYFSTFYFLDFISFHIHTQSFRVTLTHVLVIGNVQYVTFCSWQKIIYVLLGFFFLSFSRVFFSSSPISLSLLTFLSHCISCVGGSLIFHATTSSAGRQRSNPIDKC